MACKGREKRVRTGGNGKVIGLRARSRRRGSRSIHVLRKRTVRHRNLFLLSFLLGVLLESIIVRCNQRRIGSLFLLLMVGSGFFFARLFHASFGPFGCSLFAFYSILFFLFTTAGSHPYLRREVYNDRNHSALTTSSASLLDISHMRSGQIATTWTRSGGLVPALASRSSSHISDSSPGCNVSNRPSSFRVV